LNRRDAEETERRKGENFFEPRRREGREEREETEEREVLLIDLGLL